MPSRWQGGDTEEEVEYVSEIQGRNLSWIHTFRSDQHKMFLKAVSADEVPTVKRSRTGGGSSTQG